jgi:hypothetical protein
VDNVTAPDLGTGPYGVEHEESDGFYYLTLNGSRTGKQYPLGKTAYRTARKLNDEAPAAPAPKAAAPKAQPAGKALPKSKAKAAKVSAKAKAHKAKPEPAPIPEAKAEEALDLSGTLFQGTREEWLNAFVAAARPVFKQRGHELPEKIRVSVGFMFRSPKAIGQCWHEAASSDGTREIFINPTQADSSRVADILTHELAHTLFGPDEKHGKNFKKAVTDLGLEGKATATVAGPLWREWAHPILQGLGPIPHAVLDPALSGVKKQSTRLLKCECEDCGFTFRATAKWVSNGEEGLRELRCPDVNCGGVVEVKVAGE